MRNRDRQLTPWIALCGLFALFASAVSAQTTTVSVAAGPGDSLTGTQQLSFTVASAASITFSLVDTIFPSRNPNGCVAVDSTMPYSCNGSVNDSVTIVGGLSVSDSLMLSGSYVMGTVPSKNFVLDGSGACSSSETSSCTVSLDPGSYTLLLQLSDLVTPGTNAAVSPFSETLSSVVTVNSGTVVLGPIITTTQLPNGSIGESYQTALSASGGVLPYNDWALVPGAGTLPTGLTLDPSTGDISGILAASGTSCFAVTVQDADGSVSAQQPLCITVTQIAISGQITTNSVGSSCSNPGPQTSSFYINTNPAVWVWYQLQGGQQGDTAVVQWIDPTGAVAASFYPWSGSPAPASYGGTYCWSINIPSGTLTGNWSVQLVTNGVTGFTLPFTVMPPTSPPVVLPASLKSGEVNLPYSATLAASGGVPPYSNWTASPGLPAGLTVNASTGVISGTPITATGSPFCFTIMVQDSIGQTSAGLPLCISVLTAPMILTTTLPNAEVNLPYTAALAASGGTAPYGSWMVSTGQLPPGLGLDSSTGVLSGTPTSAAGSPFTFSIKVTDNASNISAAQPLSILVTQAPVITPPTIPTCEVGVPCTLTLSATGGVAPFTWAVSGSLPPGLIINPSTGVLNGTPTGNNGSLFNFAVTVTDSKGVTSVGLPISLPIVSGPAITTSTLPNGEVGVSYTVTLVASGGTPPYLWNTTGNLPPGLSLNPATGVISGTPSAASGTPFSFTVTVQDSFGAKFTTASPLNISISNSLTILTTVLPPVEVGAPYKATLSAGGGVTPYTWSITSGALPQGFSLNSSTGVIAGTATTTSGSSTMFTATVIDAVNSSASQPFQLPPVVSGPSITKTTLPNGEANVPYSATLAASGGVPPYSNWMLTGVLPPALTLDSSSGNISGTPTSANGSPFSFSVRVQDSLGNISALQALSISIAPLPLVTTTTLPNGIVTVPYNVALGVSGGTAPYIWTLNGALAPGLTLAGSNGSINGTPTTATGSPFSFTVTVKDTDGNTSPPQVLTIAVSPTLAITTQTLPAAIAGQPYGPVTLTASGGTGNGFQWAASGLPIGLSLSPVGVLSGTPSASAPGSFLVTVTVSDSSGASAKQNYAFVVQSPLQLTIAPTQLTFSSQVGAIAAQAAQSLSVFSNGSAVAFTVQSDQSWLTVSASALQTDATVTVTVSQQSSAGTLNGNVIITPTSGSLPAQKVPVIYTVAPAAPSLLLPTQTITLNVIQGGAAVTSQIAVANSGGGTLQFSAQTDQSWLTINVNNPTSVTGASPASISFTAAPGSLQPGTYTGHISITSSNSSVLAPSTPQITVLLSVTASQTTSMLLSQTGLTFNAIAGGAASPASHVAVVNVGSSAFTWSAVAATYMGGSWLQATSNGTAQTASAGSDLMVSIQPQGLAVGQYYGTVQITAPDVTNSPESISVLLNVLAPGDASGEVQLSTAGVILVSTPGDATGPSAGVTMYSLSAEQLSYSSAVFTQDGSNWLVNPASGIVTSSGTLTISANPGGLAPGTYQGAVTLDFSDGSTHTIEVGLLVAGPSGATAAPSLKTRAIKPDSGCSSTGIIAAFKSPEQNKSFAAGSSVPIQVQAIDSCKNTVTSGTAHVSFSNLDPAFDLQFNANSGYWEGTWSPVTEGADVKANALTISSASNGLYFVSQNVQIIPAPSSGPAQTHGAANAASYATAAVAPGGYVAVFGANLADPTGGAMTLPLATTLGNTQILLQGNPLPLLYVSPIQINAIVPSSVVPNTDQQLIIVHNSIPSSPVSIAVQTLQPGIFSENSEGKGQGAILDVTTFQLAAPLSGSYTGTPALPGDYIAIYCTGLGPAAGQNGEVPPADGTVTPPSPLYYAVAPAAVQFGDNPAISVPAAFSGLAPGFAGLYQVNVQVPASVVPGDAVPLTISVTDANGQTYTSNSVTIAVQ